MVRRMNSYNLQRKTNIETTECRGFSTSKSTSFHFVDSFPLKQTTNQSTNLFIHAFIKLIIGSSIHPSFPFNSSHSPSSVIILIILINLFLHLEITIKSNICESALTKTSARQSNIQTTELLNSRKEKPKINQLKTIIIPSCLPATQQTDPLTPSLFQLLLLHRP